MGDPKKLRKKYSTPIHPWNLKNIEEGRELRKEYGLRNRKEVLIAQSFLKKYKDIAKKLIASTTKQGEKEKIQVLEKLQHLGLLTAGSNLDNILGLGVKDVLNRRLQSIVYRKGLARSMKQSRQFITHRHVTVGNKEITSPSYLATLEQESLLKFKEKSNLANEDHPERINEAAEIKKEAEAIKAKEIDQDESTEVSKETKEAKEESKEETVEKAQVEEKEESKEETVEKAQVEEKEESKEETVTKETKSNAEKKSKEVEVKEEAKPETKEEATKEKKE